MVTDHHHRHSLELVLVEALAIENVVVIAHAIHVQLLLFSSRPQVGKLGAILVVVQANLAVQEVQDVQEAPEVRQEHHLGGDGELVSSLPSFSGAIELGLTSPVFLPEHNHCPLTRVRC